MVIKLDDTVIGRVDIVCWIPCRKRTFLRDLSGDWGSTYRGDMEKHFTMLKNKEIIVGVSGGIAAYKTVELIRNLTRAGAKSMLS